MARTSGRILAAGAVEETGNGGGNGLAEQKRRITINDIARLANVSKKTVSRVINQSPFVKEDTRQKIAKIIEEHGFTPDPQARGLAFRRSFLIGLVHDNPNAQMVLSLQQGLFDRLTGSGFELVVHPCDRNSPSLVADIRNFVERQKLFGVVLLPPVSENETLVAMLRDIDCPYVRIGSVMLDEPEQMIALDDRSATAEAANHLADLGHRLIGFIKGPANFASAQERFVGFAEALRSRGMPLRDDYIVQGGYTFESGIAAAEQLLNRDVRPTAIFASNDEMAAGVYRVANERGIAIPGDLSVIGFDDTAFAARMWPPLTTVRWPIRDMGRTAASRLIARMHEERERGTHQEEPLVPRLIIRGSTAKPRT